MYGIEILLEEHDNIIKFNSVVRKMCLKILDGNEPDLNDFIKVVDFGRNYADKQHHGKEEKILFAIMLDKLGPVAEKLIRNGMLVEHDLGRLYMTQLESAISNYRENPCMEGKLDIIMNASTYGDLLARHIQKENEVVYTFAERNLDDDILKQVDLETTEFESEAKSSGIQEKYLNILEELSKKY